MNNRIRSKAARARRRDSSELPGRIRGRGRGQSLVEFALVLPVLMLILLMALDLGRLFLGWINLTDAARAAANYAARNPTAWSSGNATLQAEYQALVANDVLPINCSFASPYPTPVYSPDNRIGSTATVTLSCQFSLITPLISNILGSGLTITASNTTPITTGELPEGGSVVAYVPPSTPSPAPSQSPDPSADPSAAPTPSPTPAPCVVPNFVNTKTNKAGDLWNSDAGFNSSVIFAPQAPNGAKTVTSQSLGAGTETSCTTTTITLTWSNK